MRAKAQRGGFRHKPCYNFDVAADDRMFQRSIDEQIALNAARTPTQRTMALFELLDAARALAPSDPESVERRRRAMLARQQDRERLREFCRQHLAARGSDASTGV